MQEAVIQRFLTEDKLCISDNQCFSELETLNDGLSPGEDLVLLVKGNIVYYK